MQAENVRTTVVLPAETAQKLRDLVPPRKRSAFVTEAIEERLAQMTYSQARSRSFAAWKDKDHPDLRTHEDMQRYIGELRTNEDWRRPAKKKS